MAVDWNWNVRGLAVAGLSLALVLHAPPSRASQDGSGAGPATTRTEDPCRGNTSDRGHRAGQDARATDCPPDEEPESRDAGPLIEFVKALISGSRSEPGTDPPPPPPPAPPLPEPARLQVTSLHGPGGRRLAAGTDARFPFRIHNAGTGRSGPVTVEIETNLGTPVILEGGCSALPCTLPPLGPGDSRQVDVTGRLVAPGHYQVLLTAQGPDGTAHGSTRARDASDAIAVAREPVVEEKPVVQQTDRSDVQVTLVSDPHPSVEAGHPVAFRFRIRNAGQGSSDGVDIRITSENLAAVSLRDGCAAGLSCRLPPMAPGEERYVALEGRAVAPGAFTATLAADSENDGNPDNNRDHGSGLADVAPPPPPPRHADLEVAVSDAGERTGWRREREIAFAIRNAGTARSRPVHIEAELQYFDLRTVSGDCDALPCDLGVLEPGQMRIIRLQGSVPGPGDYQVTLAAQSADDAATGNNRQRASGRVDPWPWQWLAALAATLAAVAAGGSIRRWRWKQRLSVTVEPHPAAQARLLHGEPGMDAPALSVQVRIVGVDAAPVGPVTATRLENAHGHI